MSLHNDNRIAMGEGIYYSVKSDLVGGSVGPFKDMHITVQTSKSPKADEFPNNWRYSVRAWLIIHVLYKDANLFNHEKWHKFNC